MLPPKRLIRLLRLSAECSESCLAARGSKPSASLKWMTLLGKHTGVCTNDLCWPVTASGPKSARLSPWAGANDKAGVRTQPSVPPSEVTCFPYLQALLEDRAQGVINHMLSFSQFHTLRIEHHFFYYQATYLLSPFSSIDTERFLLLKYKGPLLSDKQTQRGENLNAYLEERK